MNDYFDRVEQGMSEAVRRRAHVPWYVRILGVGRARVLVVVLACLVVAAPAVGAVTNWFGVGAPKRFPAQSRTQDAGRALPATSGLLGLRVADPQGGPPWGLRIVRTTRGDTCIQVGRVEDGKLGSLGIDGSSGNDHLFHAFPNTSVGENCGTTDAVGDGFVNVGYSGVSASADPSQGGGGVQASSRFVFMGLLGPEAASVTYRAPDGSVKTEKTSGGDGAYLLVFPVNASTCNFYARGQFLGVQCANNESMMGTSPGSPGAVTAVTYRDGHVCNVIIPQPLYMAFRAVGAQIQKLGGFHSQAGSRLYAAFLSTEHLEPNWLQKYISHPCPPVGYVAKKLKLVTAAGVAAPITVTAIPDHTYGEVLVNLTFTAREPVTSSNSWYEQYITTPRGCSTRSGPSQIGFGNVRAGQQIHKRTLEGPCKGVYHGVIGYMQNSGPIEQEASPAGIPGHDGSVIVGRFSFSIH